MLVIEGIADVYVFPKEGCKLWDTCAPHALLLAAGGNFILRSILPKHSTIY
jgi:3'-phosphoadenosine 5'-phosphosulfate (PAPS) 3'-phosphatase